MCPPPATLTAPATATAPAPIVPAARRPLWKHSDLPGLALLRDVGGSLPGWRDQARADLAAAPDAETREEMSELLALLDALAP